MTKFIKMFLVAIFSLGMLSGCASSVDNSSEKDARGGERINNSQENTEGLFDEME